MTLTKQQVDSLPAGFTPTGYVNRKQRRSKEHKEFLEKELKILTQMVNNNEISIEEIKQVKELLENQTV